MEQLNLCECTEKGETNLGFASPFLFVKSGCFVSLALTQRPPVFVIRAITLLTQTGLVVKFYFSTQILLNGVATNIWLSARRTASCTFGDTAQFRHSYA